MSSVNSDALLILLFSVFLYLVTKLMLEPDKTWLLFIFPPLLLAGAYAKERFYLAFPIAAIVLALYLLIKYRNFLSILLKNKEPAIVIALALSVIIAVSLLSPFAVNIVYPKIGFIGTKTLSVDTNLLGLYNKKYFSERIFRQFWGYFGWHTLIPLSNKIYALITWFIRIGLAGLLLRLTLPLFGSVKISKSSEDRLSFALRLPKLTDDKLNRMLVYFIFFAVMFLSFQATAAYELSGSAAQGRYLFIVIIPLIIFLMMGWEKILSFGNKKIALIILAALSFWLTMASVLIYMMPVFY